ncbi:MAG TPA: HAMP domain-containing sensor histidine kinase, partial [bacterium]|nr:HAMP domain-containing sensor histidine kinase [bacterium]
MMRLGLRGKFILAFVGLTVAFVTTFGVLATDRLRRVMTEQVRIRAKIVAEDLAREASRFITTPEGQTDTTASSRPTRRLVAGTVLYAQIIKDGKVQFSDGQADLAVPIEPLSTPLLVIERRSGSGMPYLDIIRAIPDHPLDRQTYIRVGFPLAGVYAQIRSERNMILMASLLLLAAGILSSLLVQRAILGPLHRMTPAIRHLRSGDYSARVAVDSNDELQELAGEFNAMASAVQSREQEVARVNEALQKANKIKDEFSAAMSHELKTPLHAVRAYAQLLLEEIDGPLTDAQREDLQAVVAAGDHLLALIEGILRYSALEAGGTAPQIQDVRATEIVEQARQNVAHLARSKGLPIATRGDGGATVRADETMLRQILINLLHNAIKYTSTGQITVTTSAQNGQVLFAVTDTGPGIPPEDQPEVFEPFRRAGDPARREIDGIGLGLAVVKRYVELQGGRIWFESTARRGTTFYFTLPGEGASDGGKA